LFERPHHRDVALVLQSLDPQALAQRACYFGGGTAMALRYGEYRESVDIDFMVSDLSGRSCGSRSGKWRAACWPEPLNF
jgi:hypothetical protein